MALAEELKSRSGFSMHLLPEFKGGLSDGGILKLVRSAVCPPIDFPSSKIVETFCLTPLMAEFGGKSLFEPLSGILQSSQALSGILESSGTLPDIMRASQLLSGILDLPKMLPDIVRASQLLPGILDLPKMLPDIVRASQLLPGILESSRTLPDIVGAYQSLSGITQTLEPLLDVLHSVAQNPWWKETAQDAARSAQQERVVSAGWIPHELMPLEDTAAWDDPELPDLLEDYFSENWSSVELELIKRFEGYAVDQECRDCYQEALSAHRQGFFRSVVRNLMVEIERVVREKLFPNQLTGLASLREFRELVNEQPITAIGGILALPLLILLDDHVYKNCKTSADADELLKFPNRHVALHGIRSYHSVRDSINMILLFDFIMAALTCVPASKETITN